MLSRRRQRALGRYRDRHGRLREVIALAGANGTVLVIDSDIANRGKRLLVAHLGADEPPANAELVCSLYLASGASHRARCRPLMRADLTHDPYSPQPAHAQGARLPGEHTVLPCAEQPLHCGGLTRAWLEGIDAGMSIPSLRWRRQPAPAAAARTCSLRELLGVFESYEPLCAITAAALARHEDDCQLSTTVLRAELRRVRSSPIVLNRALRERVLAAVGGEQLSMSEIALRCRRVKRDGSGSESGETSWLARRIGLLPDSGQRRPTPWVHTDVLALIAREGLGVSPREVETP